MNPGFTLWLTGLPAAGKIGSAGWIRTAKPPVTAGLVRLKGGPHR